MSDIRSNFVSFIFNQLKANKLYLGTNPMVTELYFKYRQQLQDPNTIANIEIVTDYFAQYYANAMDDINRAYIKSPEFLLACVEIEIANFESHDIFQSVYKALREGTAITTEGGMLLFVVEYSMINAAAIAIHEITRDYCEDVENKDYTVERLKLLFSVVPEFIVSPTFEYRSDCLNTAFDLAEGILRSEDLDCWKIEEIRSEVFQVDIPVQIELSDEPTFELQLEEHSFDLNIELPEQSVEISIELPEPSIELQLAPQSIQICLDETIPQLYLDSAVTPCIELTLSPVTEPLRILGGS
jgi:hypothetical protein